MVASGELIRGYLAEHKEVLDPTRGSPGEPFESMTEVRSRRRDTTSMSLADGSQARHGRIPSFLLEAGIHPEFNRRRSSAGPLP